MVQQNLANAYFDAVSVANIESNEDLADKVRKALRLTNSLRTVTEWVRRWRREGPLPQQGERLEPLNASVSSQDGSASV